MAYKMYYFYDKVDVHGRHEVHDEDCSRLPAEHNRTPIGDAKSCTEAIQKAKAQYLFKEFDGCGICSPTCHKG